jgi:hypothetical protein
MSPTFVSENATVEIIGISILPNNLSYNIIRIFILISPKLVVVDLII